MFDGLFGNLLWLQGLLWKIEYFIKIIMNEIYIVGLIILWIYI